MVRAAGLRYPSVRVLKFSKGRSTRHEKEAEQRDDRAGDHRQARCVGVRSIQSGPSPSSLARSLYGVSRRGEVGAALLPIRWIAIQLVPRTDGVKYSVRNVRLTPPKKTNVHGIRRAEQQTPRTTHFQKPSRTEIIWILPNKVSTGYLRYKPRNSARIHY